VDVLGPKSPKLNAAEIILAAFCIADSSEKRMEVPGPKAPKLAAAEILLFSVFQTLQRRGWRFPGPNHLNST
jgi:hypothetical protein